RVASTGLLLDTVGFKVADGTRPAVTYEGPGYQAVVRTSSGSVNVYSISTAGVVGGPSIGISPCTSGRIASGGGTTLLVADCSTGTYGRRVSGGGTFLVDG